MRRLGLGVIVKADRAAELLLRAPVGVGVHSSAELSLCDHLGVRSSAIISGAVRAWRGHEAGEEQQQREGVDSSRGGPGGGLGGWCALLGGEALRQLL